MITRHAILNQDLMVIDIVDCDESINSHPSMSTKEILENIFIDNYVIKETEKTGTCFINSFYYKDIFTQPKPYPSWEWKDEKWQAPKKYPENNKVNFWNEEKLHWEEFLEAKK